ncbi:MAG: Alanine-tRNA ligase [candidate division WS6 bacterium GW2011_GWF2_39_15]|uniref:alanine--tRNA ligase n=1 Tax=candidate division WS6 bacterium GW2011_GWF2_39_15 TaxID=1619100 RepID=A0A0G0QVF6_9BACT|nr:MAG: Alanine-tRNA ligase [candidate division WS6 bacterium GW2011_GWF2_39_15]
MKSLGYLEIRELFLKHLEEKGHTIIPSSSLVPEDNPSVLFVNAGMFPLIPYLLGEPHPGGVRLANSQRCLRTIDIEEVGDATHCTTFEMLGNWSINDYFKEEALRITLSFFVDKLGFDINKISSSVFKGNEDAPKDTESIEIWKKLFSERGIKAQVGERIRELPKEDNWWEPEGGGPCGPDSETFYEIDGNLVEIGNDVFMQYLKKDNTYSPLGKHNVDFGGGLDRLAMICQEVPSVYETDIYLPILKKVQELSKEHIVRSHRIIVDHIKASAWIIADGVVPGRTQREYILRRLIRRAIRHGRSLGIENLFTRQVAEIVINQFSAVHPLLESNRESILNILEDEEKKFNQTLGNGLKEFEKTFRNIKEFKNENGETFRLYETYGFPLEITLEELTSRGIDYDEELVKKNHEKAYEEHQEKSRTASKGLFKGGMADTSEISTRYHTATHLLLASLYNIVGPHIYQKGSNITTERLRLDFPNDEKLTDKQIEQVEDMVNEQIQKSLPVIFKEMDKEEAMKIVKYAAFEDKYGDIVKVYTIGSPDSPFSQEICGGPHVENTKDLGHFKIVKQENVGAGIKRIKAVLE